MRVRCPECDRGFSVEDDPDLVRADCPVCGETIPLDRDRESDRGEPRRHRPAESEGRPRGHRYDEGDQERTRRRWEDDAEDRARRRAGRHDEEFDDWPPRPKKRRSTPLSPRLKVLLFGGPVLLVMSIALAGWLLWRPPFRAELFRPYLPAYMGFSFQTAPAGTRVGKMVVVNLDTRDFEMMDFLPPSVRAASPEEVTTVAQLRWTKKQVGTYTNGSPAHEWSCDVTVLDLRSGGVIERQHIAGSQAPQTVRIGRTSSTPTEGHKPTGEVVNYLTRLVRR